MKAEIYYGKADVATYRTYGTPLSGLTPIPESSFRGKPNILMAATIEVRSWARRSWPPTPRATTASSWPRTR